MAWITAIVFAAAACGRGGQVQTGAGADGAAELVQRSITRALAAHTYRARVGMALGEPAGAEATGGSVCGFGEPGATHEVAVGEKGHRTALLDRRSGAVRVLRDDREPVAYLASATLPGSGSAPTEWVRVGTADLATATGLASLVPSLWNDLSFIAGNPASSGLLTVLQRSAAVVTAVDRSEMDGVAVSHQRVTVDRQRFAAAEQDQLRSAPDQGGLLGIPPGTVETHVRPTDAVPTFDTWVDDQGTLRRVVVEGPMPAGSDSRVLRLEITYGMFDEGFPATMPSSDEATELGSLPASVLFPLPDCLGSDGSLPLTDKAVPPTLMDSFKQYTECVTSVREEAAAGRTVAQWVEHANAVGFNGRCPFPAPLSPMPDSPAR